MANEVGPWSSLLSFKLRTYFVIYNKNNFLDLNFFFLNVHDQPKDEG